ncbi:beta-1,3-glucan-binding protein-like [Hyposmocoma kahamanoa]|uniref:beta-1,3-glucan-binding protein-like n=1 Tax=Hyposmocoma kahamanoa TaxID=1477025 RepID=UPI000E6D6618|nr:beta-1,3-glucan-binding protein-like [Hyposmocoma kahamanoa]
MAVIKIHLLALAVFCSVQSRAASYEVPPAKLEAIYPKGLRVSVPDDGFSLFAFHGNLNVEMDGLEAGQWARDITKVKDGRWTFRDRNVELKIGDKIYFWTYVIKNGLGYRQDDGVWEVTGYVDEEGKPVNPATPQPPAMPKPVVDAPVIPKPISPSCTVSQTVVAGLNAVCKNSLLFSEEFNKDSVDSLVNWQAEHKFLDEPDYPFNLYMSDGTMSIKDGNLVIAPVLTEDKYNDRIIYDKLDLSNKCTSTSVLDCRREASGAQILPPVITGKITTKNKFAFKFGRIEVRAKMPNGNWLIPEINLEPLENFYGPHRYESGLMRVAFVKGNPTFAKKLMGGPVLGDTEPFRSYLLKEKIGIENWNKDFHNYTLIWRPDGLTLFVDGEQYGTVDPGEGFYNAARQNAVPHASQWLKGSLMAPLDRTFYLALGLRVGGINDFADAPDKPWTNRGRKALVSFYEGKSGWEPTWYDANLKVDYIRVHSL